MKVDLVFALHFHQPVGNFDHVFQLALDKCYEPIVAHFERHQRVKAAFHFSGCLLEWLQQHAPRYLDRVIALVGSGQVEPLGGGFYEPILTVIPPDDAQEQLDRLSNFWETHAGVRPRGAWLTERVWEASLPVTLADAGISYTILDDQHLRFAGCLDDFFSGLYVTERWGKPVGFFPSDFMLRYLIPFRTVDVIEGHFSNLAKRPERVVVTYGDDAEKFGMWPGTDQWVFGEKWLEKFFVFLERDDAPVQTLLPRDYPMAQLPPKKIYMPNASYAEMLEWALPPDSVDVYTQVRRSALKDTSEQAVKSFVRGSLWDMFFVRYPESDHMHKHVLFSSEKLKQLSDRMTVEQREQARSAVLRAQCNCAYWHGLFGGVYLPHLRQGIYQNILAADSIIRSHQDGVVVEQKDLDGDLRDEVILSSSQLQAFFKPDDGGTMTELDYLPQQFNFTNIMSRWRESYHSGTDITHEQAESSGVLSPHEQSLGITAKDLRGIDFDQRPQRSLRDLFTPSTPSHDNIHSVVQSRSLCTPPREFQVTDRGWLGHYQINGLTYAKSVHVETDSSLRVSWAFDGAMNGWFGTVITFSLLTPQAPGRHLRVVGEDHNSEVYHPGVKAVFENVEQIIIEDEYLNVRYAIAPSAAARVLTVPIETLQRSEHGYERLYQGSLLVFFWGLDSQRLGQQLQLLLSLSSMRV